MAQQPRNVQAQRAQQQRAATAPKGTPTTSTQDVIGGSVDTDQPPMAPQVAVTPALPENATQLDYQIHTADQLVDQLCETLTRLAAITNTVAGSNFDPLYEDFRDDPSNGKLRYLQASLAASHQLHVHLAEIVDRLSTEL